MCISKYFALGWALPKYVRVARPKGLEPLLYRSFSCSSSGCREVFLKKKLGHLLRVVSPWLKSNTDLHVRSQSPPCAAYLTSAARVAQVSVKAWWLLPPEENRFTQCDRMQPPCRFVVGAGACNPPRPCPHSHPHPLVWGRGRARGSASRAARLPRALVPRPGDGLRDGPASPFSFPS